MADITQTGAQRFNSIGEEYNSQFSSPTEKMFASLQKQLDVYSQLNPSQKRAVIPAITPTRIDITKEAIEAGFGDSRYDRNIWDADQLRDLNELRAQSQSGLEQIGNGILKGGILAATTFADGVVGTWVGALNSIGSDTPLNSFIENPFSRTMQQINKWSEEALPNYYSRDEREQPWWENVFTANFFGDKFVKNLGFTIGAAYSGRVNAGIISKALGLSDVRNAFKGLVTTADGRVLTNANEIAKAYAAGDAFMDGVKLTNDLGKAAKNLKNAEIGLKMVGGISAAMGEGRIEAISNTDDWRNLHRQQIEDDYNKTLASLMQDLDREHPEWFSFVPMSPEGGIQGGLRRELTNPEGKAEYARRVQALTERKQQALAQMNKYAADMANEIFLFNTLLLSVNNTFEFGRFFSGGYNRGRNFMSLTKKGPNGELIANRNPIIGAYLRAGAVPFVEANEEMAQSFISTSIGLKAAARLNSFYGKSIDQDATEDLVNWYNAAAQGFRDTYGNSKSWEEGFIGFLTGLLGMPFFHMSKTEDGKDKLSFSMDGELWQGMKEARELSAEQQSILTKMNEVIQSPEYLNYFQGVVRDRKLQAEKEAALEAGDPYEYKNAEHAQLISRAIMFDKADMVQDMYDDIDALSNVTEDDIPQIKQATTDKETGKSVFDGMTNSEIIEHFKKEGEQIKDAVNKYIEISRNLKTLYGDTISEDVLNEMVYTLTQVDNWEKRFKDMFAKVRESAKQDIESHNSRLWGHNEQYRSNLDLSQMSAEELLNTITAEEFDKIWKSNIKHAEKKNLGTLEAQQFLQDLQDMYKIYQARKAFISKYHQLSVHPELFTEEGQKQMQEFVRSKNKEVDNQVLEAVKDFKSAKEVKEYLIANLQPNSIDRALEGIIENGNESIKQIASEVKNYFGAVKAINDILTTLPQTPEAAGAISSINNILATTSSPSEIDTAFNSVLAEIKKTSPKTAEIIQGVYDGYKGNQKSASATAAKPVVNPVTKSKKTEDPNVTSTAASLRQFVGLPPTSAPQIDTSSLESIIASIDEMSDSQLEDIVKGKKLSGFDKLSAAELANIKEVANAALQLRKKAFANPADDNEADNKDIIEETTTDYKQILRSWVMTKYSIAELKDHRIIRTAGELVDALDNLGAYDFVDKGYLGILFQDNEDLPIYYIKPKDPKYEGNILLAIRYSDEANKKVKGHFIPIEGSDSNKYQIVGVLGASESAKEELKKVKMLIDTEFNSSDKQDAEYYVASFTNQIRHIYSGRMVLEGEGLENIKRNRNISKEALSQEGVGIGVWYDTSWKTFIDIDKEILVPLNRHNKNPRDGSIWFLTKEADGRWYPKAIKVKRFTTAEWNIEEHRDTPLGKEIVRLAKDIVDPSKSTYQRALAKYALMDIIYMPEDVQILFNGNQVTIKQDAETIASITDGNADKFLAGLQDSDLNLRFQIDASELVKGPVAAKDYLQKVLDSGILYTDLYFDNPYTGYHNGGASFDLYAVGDDGGIMDDTTTKVGHTGGGSVITTKNKTSYHINGEQVYKSSNGDISVMKNGKEVLVTDGEEKNNATHVINIIDNIKSGKLKPIKNTKVYKLDASTALLQVQGGWKFITGQEALETIAAAERAATESKKVISVEELQKKIQEAKDKDLHSDNPPSITPATDAVLSSVGIMPTEDNDGFEGLLPNQTEEESTDVPENVSKELKDQYNKFSQMSTADLKKHGVSINRRECRAAIKAAGIPSVAEFKKKFDALGYDVTTLDNIESIEDFNSYLELVKNGCRAPL